MQFPSGDAASLRVAEGRFGAVIELDDADSVELGGGFHLILLSPVRRVGGCPDTAEGSSILAKRATPSITHFRSV